MRAENVQDEAVIHLVTNEDSVFSIDEEALAADGTADAGGEFRWPA
jgi:hypothetical protein